jgi:hypothetical protein
MAPLRELDGLSDCRVCWHALHVQELRGAQSKKVVEIGVEPIGAAVDARVEICIEPRAAAQHSVRELAHPAPIARVETSGPAVERLIE